MASLAAMGSEGSGGKPFWSDHEITVDRDGIPHYTGASPSLMKEYTRRVRFAYGGLEGEGKDAEAEAADLEKKQCRFARRLVDALHGEAWRAVEHLVMQPEKLRKKDGFEEVLLALGTIEKEGVIRKTEAFDKFFESTRRARGEAIDAYLRRKNQAWRDLRDLDESSAMSEDLLSYFVLKGCGLTREDRHSILLANKSKYDQAGIEQSLRVSFHDMHEKEKTGGGGWQDRKRSGPKKRYYANEVIDEEFPEDEQTDQAYYQYESEYDEVSEQAYYQEEDGDGAAGPGSDAGASGDDDVYEAYAAMDKTRQTYKDARKRLRDVQKSRGFYRGGSAWPNRDQAKEKEKARSRCAACGALGHWAGDHNCPKTRLMLDRRRGVASRRVAPRARSRPRASMQPLLTPCSSRWMILMEMMLERCIATCCVVTLPKKMRCFKMLATPSLMIEGSPQLALVAAMQKDLVDFLCQHRCRLWNVLWKAVSSRFGLRMALGMRPQHKVASWRRPRKSSSPRCWPRLRSERLAPFVKFVLLGWTR